jgi:Protein of unknown function (DUF3866)
MKGEAEEGSDMLRVAAGMVMEVREKRPGMQILEVRLHDSGLTEPAVSFFAEDFTKGDEVLVNTTAVRLQLGTGGFHIVMGKTGRSGETDLFPGEWGHVIKMRYAPSQLAVDTTEEQDSPYHELFRDETLSLEGTPVVIGELHSLLPAAAAAVKWSAPEKRLVYVMPDAASLPIALSRQVERLKSAGVLAATVTTGHAWGGDRETVTIHNGLLAARHVEQADVILCFLGPGVTGTGTPLGFSGMQLAEVIHAVSLLGGVPFFIPRLSFADPRERHFGVSHHTRTVLGRFALRPVLLVMPAFGDGRDDFLRRQTDDCIRGGSHVLVSGQAPEQPHLERLERVFGLSFVTMGRHWREDPAPFQAAVLAGDLAVQSAPFLDGCVSGGKHRCAGPDTLAALALFLTRSGA